MVLRSVLKIEGPPGSGKTRELAREACRLIAQDGVKPEEILFLANARQNGETIRRFLHEEAKLAGLPALEVRIRTLDDFYLTCLKENNPDLALLEEDDALALLAGLLISAPHWGDSSLLPPNAVLSLARPLWQLFQDLERVEISPEALQKVGCAKWISELYPRWLRMLKQLNLVTRACLATQSFEHASGIIGSAVRFIFADEVQEWPETLHRALAKLPVNLVFAGQAALSIRRHWGASPECFETLQPYAESKVTLLPRQACMRGPQAVLSLVNRLLPTPVWEEQQVDVAQLRENIRFGAFTDPRQEAQAVAAFIERWLRETQVEDRPARPDDCVILLRSAHYQPILMDALLERQIPFYSEILSEEALQLQRGLYDLLVVFAAMQELGVPPAVVDSPGTSVEVAERIRQANRYARRWLDTRLSELDALAPDWALFAGEDDERLLLIELLNHEQTPPVVLLEVKKLMAWYEAYIQENSLGHLLALLEAEWLPDFQAETLELAKVWEQLKKRLDTWDSRHQHALGASFRLTELLAGYALLWDGTRSTDEQDEKPRVRILKFRAMQGEEAPLVIIPFMVADEFPLTRHAVELLEPETLEALGLSDGVLGRRAAHLLEDEARLLALGLSRTRQTLWLSTHLAEAGDREKPVLPSHFYTLLLNARREWLGQEVSPEICDCGEKRCNLDECGFRPEATLEQVDDLRYVGASVWADYQPEVEEAVFGAEEVLNINPSVLHTYMVCPRQFYYKHLLKLPQPESAAATLGSLVHRVFEVFNKNAEPGMYTPERLKELVQCLFCFASSPADFERAGFRARDREMLETLNPLALEDLKRRLLESIDDLERKGYFALYQNARAIHAERKLEDIAIEGLDRCRFTGKLDAIIQRADGQWDILDYKTYRNAYDTGLDTCDKHFAATLEPLPDEPDLSPSERFGHRLNPTYPKDYQLPLYYLACSQEPTYRGNIRAVALQMVRPAFADNQNQGAIRLELTAQAIEEAKERLVADINEYLVRPILSATTFQSEPDNGGCDYCPYRAACDDSEQEDLA